MNLLSLRKKWPVEVHKGFGKLKAGLPPWTVKSDHGRWLCSMVRLPWSNSLNNQSTKSLGPSLGDTKWGPRGMTMYQKMNVMVFLLIYAQIKFDHSLIFSCLHLLFPPQKYYSKYLFNISLSWTPAFFYESIFFASPTAKPFGPCQRIMYVLKYVFWGTQTPWSPWHFFPWCKLKWSWDKFKANHGFYKTLGWLHGPWCKQHLTHRFKIIHGIYLKFTNKKTKRSRQVN
jgi:hypothetical protein